jgi:glycine/D-amino acid oxidase-like deaminating enzyme
VGLLQIGPPEGIVVRGVLEAARQHGLAVESLTAKEVHSRFPGFRVPEGSVGAYEPAAGYLKVERCVLAHIAAAKQLGAEFQFGSAASQRRTDGGDVVVDTEAGQSFRAKKLILTAGAWAPALLAELQIALTIRRKHLYWFPQADADYRQDRGCPTFFYELPQGLYYGFPQMDDFGVKVAEHTGGDVVRDPLHDPRQLDAADLARVEAFLAAQMPGVTRRLGHRCVCFYTMSPDEHFIVDQSPNCPNTFFAAGLSGHGFKFTSVLGHALAELALEGRTALPIGFLSAARFKKT